MRANCIYQSLKFTTCLIILVTAVVILLCPRELLSRSEQTMLHKQSAETPDCQPTGKLVASGKPTTLPGPSCHRPLIKLFSSDLAFAVRKINRDTNESSSYGLVPGVVSFRFGWRWAALALAAMSGCGDLVRKLAYPLSQIVAGSSAREALVSYYPELTSALKQHKVRVLLRLLAKRTAVESITRFIVATLTSQESVSFALGALFMQAYVAWRLRQKRLIRTYDLEVFARLIALTSGESSPVLAGCRAVAQLLSAGKYAQAMNRIRSVMENL